MVVISSQEQLDEIVLDWLSNGPGFDPNYDGGYDYAAWTSPYEALLDMADRWPDGDPGRAECLEMAESTRR